MPATTKNSNADKSKTTMSKKSTEGKSSNSKKQGSVNLKTPSATEKARGFDEGRRNDANSNEL